MREIIAKRPRSDDIDQRRRDIDAQGKHYKPLEGVVVGPVDANGASADWTSTPIADTSNAILDLDGGCDVIASLDSHCHGAAEACRAARARTSALDYRLAPEHPFPAAVEDAVAGYRLLLAAGMQPDGITIAGGLVVPAMMTISRCRPAAARLRLGRLATVDMEAIGESMTSKAPTDPTVQKTTILEMANLYSPRRRSMPICEGSRRCSSRSAPRRRCWMTRFGSLRRQSPRMLRWTCRSGRR